ncbi:MAG TPA: YiiX/YebB-like N1pC/P60 family cysteine hydrolase [Usitatibacter sp.]|nr:YiiX/YebB-like N1pC/P60 family cysteine hydrolase [Usitatibacter sp.]
MAALSAAAAVLLAGGCAAPVVVTPPEPSTRQERDTETLSAVRALGRDGDWLVVRGYHASDDLVAALTNKPFTHAAVLDLAHGRVVEAEAQGVHFTPLAQFVAKSHRLMLVRPVWSDAERGQHAVAKARAVVGRPYDFLGLIGLDVPDRYYCSGLAIEIYRPFIRAEDLVPRPVEPGQLHHWGRILYDSGAA